MNNSYNTMATSNGSLKQEDVSIIHPSNEKEESIGSSGEYESAVDESERTELLQRSASVGSQSSYASAQKEKWRNLIAYWFLGLTNNFGYVIMLSAAHDILSEGFNNQTISSISSNIEVNDSKRLSTLLLDSDNPRDCNMLSTGTVLLADIIPSLAIKMVAPFIPVLIHLRISGVVALCTISFLLVGLASSSSMALLGVVFASASAGLGETTFLAYSSYYHQDVVSTWSSGTGGAGLFGALSYAALTSFGLSSRQSILLMLIVPIIMSLSFWHILEHPPALRCCPASSGTCWSYANHQINPSQVPPHSLDDSRLSFDQKFRIIPSLLKFMIPLTLVYVAEYLINQGLSELLYFPEDVSWISHDEQYRWYQVLYQVGVLISRSSVNLVYIQRIWITSVLQWINVVLFLTAAIFWWFGTIWLAFSLILWEGLLGGAAYVNTFYRLSQEVIPQQKEFAIQMTSMSDTFGITLAGFIAIPLHNAICNLPTYR